MKSINKFEYWIREHGAGGDLELSYSELLEVYGLISIQLETHVHKIRLYEKYGPYCTCAYLMNQLENKEGVTLSYWDRETEIV